MIYLFTYLLCERVVYVSVSVLCVWCMQRPEEAFKFQELELQMVLSYHEGAGNEGQVICKRIQCF